MSVITTLTSCAAKRSLVMHDLALPLEESILLPRCDRITLNPTEAVEIHPGALAQRHKTRSSAAQQRTLTANRPSGRDSLPYVPERRAWPGAAAEGRPRAQVARVARGAANVCLPWEVKSSASAP